MSVVKRLCEVLGVLLLALQVALVGISVYRALTGGVAQVYVLDVPLLLPLQIEEPARAILRLLYEIFYWVLLGVVIVAGIQAALGLVHNFIVAFLPISFPRGSVNSLIRAVLGIFVIKAIVDGVLRYLGYSPGVTAALALGLPVPATWTGVGLLAAGAAIAALLCRGVVELG
ncbi:MAG: hypothetical protein DRJ96_08955 [Thermoprotei archaeon]|nr:MAG: hypothetical protein DRJ96_08955 [Thermoprotei archaeon]